MSLLGFLLGGAREALEEKQAKYDLEDQLGRRLSNEEQYSLGTHLDAAQATDASRTAYAPRETAMPFAEARPSFKKRWLLAIVGIPLIFIIGIGAFVVVENMPEHIYNRLNPFTPKPPAGEFAAQIGDFKRADEIMYHRNEYTKIAGASFDADYLKQNSSVKYTLWNYSTAAEAQDSFKKYLADIKSNKEYQLAGDSETRFAAVWKKMGTVVVYWLDGAKLKKLYGDKQVIAYELEALITSRPPAEVVKIEANSGASTINTSGSEFDLLVSEMLGEYKKNEAAADKKFTDQIVILTGKVQLSGKDNQGAPLLVLMTPGDVYPKDPSIMCSFDPSKAAVVAGISKGATVNIQCRVIGSVSGNVLMKNCEMR